MDVIRPRLSDPLQLLSAMLMRTADKLRGKKPATATAAAADHLRSWLARSHSTPKPTLTTQGAPLTVGAMPPSHAYKIELDALTGLANEQQFVLDRQRLLQRARARQCTLGLLLIDLDHFAAVNLQHGRPLGDQLLVAIARQLERERAPDDLLFRLGGDQFALLLWDAGEAELANRLRQLHRNLAAVAVGQRDTQVSVTASSGLACAGPHEFELARLLVQARAALALAKQQGRNGWHSDDAARRQASSSAHATHWDRRIKRALANNLFELHLQGVYHAHDGSLAHAEALLRLRDDELGGKLVMPGAFIAPAEQDGNIFAIDRWVIGEAVGLLTRHPQLPPLALNLSGHSLADAALPAHIAGLITRAGIAPSRILLEVTETAGVTDLATAQHFLKPLRALGCTICLDDFGVGYSSLSYLKQLEVDIVKIDGLFVRDLLSDPASRVLVQGIVAMAHALGKRTVAEYVENDAVLALLRALGVDLVQGYLFDQPRPVQAWLG